jgi:antitoxin component YwqK of YwqJK toxin-antitoxin module
MKYLILVTALVFIFSCRSKTEVVEKFQDGNPKKVIEHIDKNKLFEKSYFENGHLKEVKYFEDGKQSGEHIYYREDGTKSAISNFKNGLRNGLSQELFSNGQIAFQGNLIDDKFEGVSIWYFENGKVHFVGNRHLDKDTGWWYYFNINGDTIRRSYSKSINDSIQYYNGKGRKIMSEEWEKLGDKENE